MIKKPTVEDITKILILEDDKLTKVFPCEIGEWVQFLIQNVDNPNFFMRVAIEENKLIGYLVAFNAIAKPISNCVSVLYSKTAGTEINRVVLEELIRWSKDKGAASIDFVTDNVVGHTVYGFKKKTTMMTMEL